MANVVDRLNAALEGRYVVERALGEGGMATVYLAQDVRHERPVAMKVFRPELSAVLGADRFLAEIKTTANLQHPHILALYDSGEADGLLFYVMPYVEDESLRDSWIGKSSFPWLTRFASRLKWPTRWSTPTASPSSTETSNPPMSFFRTAAPSCRTSGSPWP